MSGYLRRYILNGATERWLAHVRPYMSMISDEASYNISLAAAPPAVVYVLLSPFTGKFYIGSTRNFKSRMYQHFRAATLPSKRKQAVHRFLASFGLHRFCCLPIAVVHPAYLLQVEYKLIGLLNPSLNRDLMPISQTTQHSSSTTCPTHLMPVSKASQRPLKKFRLHNPNPQLPLPTIYMAIKNAEGSVSLAGVLLQHLHHSNFWVSCYIGSIHVEDKKALINAFGSTIVSAPSLGLPPLSLRRVLPTLRQSPGHHMLFIPKVVFTAKVRDTHLTLLDILRFPGMIRGLYTLSLESLFMLYQAASFWKAPKTRLRLMTIINRVFRKRTKVSLAYKPVIRIPFGCEHFKDAAVTALARIIESWPVPFLVKKFFFKAARIVVKKGPTIGAIILNYRKVCKTISFPLILAGAHKVVSGFKASCSAVPDMAKPVLNQHMKFVPPLPSASAQNCLADALHSLDKVASSLGTNCVELDCVRREFAESVSNRFSESSGLDDGWLLSVRYTKMWIECRDLVVSTLDKNGNCFFIEPLLSYAVRMDRTFLQDPHYTHVNQSESDLLGMCRVAYLQNCWNKLGKLQKGELGCAYVLPKNKDPLNKERPIVPATKHPLRKVFSIAARALVFLIGFVKLSHFNILATKDFKTFVASANDWIRESCDRVIGVTFDVKNMFTDLEHGDTLQSLSWFLDQVKLQSRHPSVTVTRSGRNGVQFGRNLDTKTVVTVPINKLFNIAKFELEHTFFKVGIDVILHQRIGIAMGGFQSPPLAMIVAACAEFKWLTSLGIDQKRIRGARFVDDAMVLFKGPNAHLFIHSLFSSCYPKGLQLECTGFGTRFKILECEIFASDSGIFSSHFNSNTCSMILDHKQAFLKFIPWGSGHPKAVLSNTILGLLHRIWFNTSSLEPTVLLPHLVSYFLELALMGYPASCFRNAIKRFLRHERIRKDPQFQSWQLVLRVAAETDLLTNLVPPPPSL
jgi:hypothetical protein